MKISLRKVTLKDALLLFNWANDSEVRKNSFTNNKIEWAEHIVWLEKKLSNSDNYFYLFFNDNQIPLGLIRIEKGEKAIIGVTVAKQYRGKGIGRRIIDLGCKEFWKTNEADIFAKIKPSNKGSLKAFQKAGFGAIENLSCSGEPECILKTSKNVD